MKKNIILPLFLLAGALTFSACSSNTSSSSSTSSAHGNIQDSNSLEFDPFTSSYETSEEDTSSSEEVSSSEVLSEKIVGTWAGADDSGTYFTVTVNEDGSAVLSFTDWYDEYHEYNFTFDHDENGWWYYFTYNEDDNIQIIIHVLNNTFEIVDDDMIINDYDTFCIFGTIYDFQKYYMQ